VEPQVQNSLPEVTLKKSSLRQLALVEYDGKRHLAEQDETGKWWTISRHKELPQVITVIRLISKY
jgi:hypothetical protein